MTDSSVRRRVFVIDLGFRPVRGRIFRRDCRASAIRIADADSGSVSLSGNIFLQFRANCRMHDIDPPRYSFATCSANFVDRAFSIRARVLDPRPPSSESELRASIVATSMENRRENSNYIKQSAILIFFPGNAA